jgi:hypothetical protein
MSSWTKWSPERGVSVTTAVGASAVTAAAAAISSPALG